MLRFFLVSFAVLLSVYARPQNADDQAAAAGVAVAGDANVIVVTPSTDHAPGKPLVVVVPGAAAGADQPPVVESVSGAPVAVSDDSAVTAEAATEAATEATTAAIAAEVPPTPVLVGLTAGVGSPADGTQLGEWRKGAQYNVGDIVSWGGQRFKALQKHSADAYNWTPPQAPSLWVQQ